MTGVYLSDYEMRALSVRCTLCGAATQENCHDELGRSGRPHVARLEAYERANGNPGAWGGTGPRMKSHA